MQAVPHGRMCRRASSSIISDPVYCCALVASRAAVSVAARTAHVRASSPVLLLRCRRCWWCACVAAAVAGALSRVCTVLVWCQMSRACAGFELRRTGTNANANARCMVRLLVPAGRYGSTATWRVMALARLLVPAGMVVRPCGVVWQQ